MKNITLPYELETINCPFCDKNDYKIYIKDARELYNGLGDKFNVVQCDYCQFIYTNPRPTRDTIKYFYPNESGYYLPQDEVNNKKQKLRNLLLNSVLKYEYGYNLEPVLPKYLSKLIHLFFGHKIDCMHVPTYKNNGVLLDIGCSWGHYLKRMSSLGWKTYGTEMNFKAYKYATDKFNLKNINNGFFEDFSWKKNFFDVVHMSMVLEHVYNPKEILKKIHRCLKSDGEFILSVPDISGLEFKIYKHNAYGLQVPQHLSHFSSRNIKKFFSANGFTINKIKHHSFDRDMVASLNYGNRNLLKKFVHNKLFRNSVLKLFIFILSRFGMTSRMSIYAKKI